MKGLLHIHRTTAGVIACMTAIALQLPAQAQQRTPWQGQQSYRSSLLNDEERGIPADIHTGTPGEIEVVRERYPDGKVKVERQVTLDDNGNYVNHGAWKMLTPNGEVSAEGQYNMGQRVGLWSRWVGRNESPTFGELPFNQFKAPYNSQVNFTDGQMDGDWLITDANHKKCLQISLKSGQRNGPAITWLPNGKVYRQATYDQNVPVGDVMEINEKSGELVRADSYIDGRKVTTKVSYHSGGSQRQKKTESTYLAATTVQQSPDEFWNFRLAKYNTTGKDLKHGPSKAWFANGKQQFEGSYQNGKKSGSFTYWHENGQIAATGEYKEDRAEGIWVWWHKNGQKSAVGRYQNGTLIGEWKWWNEEGRLTKQHEYDGSESISSQEKDSFDIGERPDRDEASVR
jgi:antitoxin component YwqK of YwqJK toxin-antitoxin module